MKKIFLVLVMLIACCLIPAVSAETIIDEEFTFFDDTGGTYTNPGKASANQGSINTIIFRDITKYSDLSYVAFTIGTNGISAVPSDGSHEFTYTGLTVSKTGRFHVERIRNLLGVTTGYRYIVFFDDWDIGSKTGLTNIQLSESFFRGSYFTDTSGNSNGVIDLGVAGTNPCYLPYTITVASTNVFKNHLTVNDDYTNSYQINLKRVYDDKAYASTIYLMKDETTVMNEGSTEDFTTIYLKSDINTIRLVTSGEAVFLIPLTSGDTGPDDEPVTVYVRNSQTGAAIANSRCVIDALVDGDYYPVVNRTEPSGIFSVTLQPTGGGSPNPDGYRLIASADGYNNPMPEINFTVDEYTTSIYCYLDPIAGGPIDENKTFINFFVRDMSANPISGATINFGGYTLLTNSQGYTVFEVGKNATYTYTVSKSGYGSLTGNVVIGADPRHTINTVLSPAVTPTTPTPIPTSTPISPTPTMTAPTGEPVSNWLEWFAAHFGMILGGGVEIGKIFMWLCFSVPVGVYVAKEAKAGAAGFMAGAGVVTLFFTLIGWVPIWLLVFIALIIGLLYAKIFNNSDNGGGR